MTEHPVKSNTADVVIIGGGILGCCAAYHLQKLGAGKIILIERAPALGRQTSWAGAGFVSLWSTEFLQDFHDMWDSLELEIERYGLQFYHQLGTAHDIKLKAVGMLRLALTSAGAQLQADQYASAGSMAAPNELELLSPGQVGQVLPLVETSRVHSGLYWPTAVQIDPAHTVAAVGRELVAAGVEVYTDAAVTGIKVSQGRVSGVQTSAGFIATRTVVNAAGAWLNQIGQMAGVALPITPLLAARFVTEPIPELPAHFPMTILTDYYDMYLREDGGGLLIGAYDEGVSENRRIFREAPADVSTLPTDMARSAQRLALACAETFPIFRSIQVKEMRSGLPAYTADGRHFLGQAEHVAGFYVVGGDNEAGITHGPGLGKLVAELVVHNQTSLDVSAYRLDRFNDKPIKVETITELEQVIRPAR